MGWDAFSSAKYYYRSKRFRDLAVGRLFKTAAKFVKEKTDNVDGSLHHGVLDVSTCAEMLQKATGQSCWREDGWSVEDVQEYTKKANWDFDYDKEDAWAYWSARKFLEVCAEAKLSISFSW